MLPAPFSVWRSAFPSPPHLSFQVLDIPRVLDKLRQQRMMLVQTLIQYTFVYRVLIQFLKSSRLI